MMPTPAIQDASAIAGATGAAQVPVASSGKTIVWHPPELMRRYQINKAIGAGLFIVIFAGWLVIQWSNPVMRVVAGGLLVLTVWYTFKSIAGDWARTHRRQIAIESGAVRITEQGNVTRVPLTELARMEWRDATEAEFGLWLSAADHRMLAHLGPAFIANPEEARAFMGWLREHTGATFEARWPDEA